MVHPSVQMPRWIGIDLPNTEYYSYIRITSFLSKNPQWFPYTLKHGNSIDPLHQPRKTSPFSTLYSKTSYYSINLPSLKWEKDLDKMISTFQWNECKPSNIQYISLITLRESLGTLIKYIIMVTSYSVSNGPILFLKFLLVQAWMWPNRKCNAHIIVM